MEEEPLSKIFLYYGNRTENDVIFKEELVTLQNKYKDQLEIEFIYSQGPKEKKGLSLFKKEKNTPTHPVMVLF